jgi:hypothetical protein
MCVCLDLYFTILSLLVFFLSSEYEVDMTWNLYWSLKKRLTFCGWGAANST